MIVWSRGAPCLHCPHSPVVTLYGYNVGCNAVMHNLVMCRYNVAFTHDGLTNGAAVSTHVTRISIICHTTQLSHLHVSIDPSAVHYSGKPCMVFGVTVLFCQFCCCAPANNINVLKCVLQRIFYLQPITAQFRTPLR